MAQKKSHDLTVAVMLDKSFNTLSEAEKALVLEAITDDLLAKIAVVEDLDRRYGPHRRP